MLGGVDVDISTPADAPWEQSLESILRAAKFVWPCAVVQCGESARCWSINDPDLLQAGLHELFIYKDNDWRIRWEELGAVPENENTMIHLLPGADDVTAVIDSLDHEDMKQLLALFRSALEREPIFRIEAEAGIAAA